MGLDHYLRNHGKSHNVFPKQFWTMRSILLIRTRVSHQTGMTDVTGIYILAVDVYVTAHVAALLQMKRSMQRTI